MRSKRETHGAFCVLNANAKSQTRKSMKINVICTVQTQVIDTQNKANISIVNRLRIQINSSIRQSIRLN